MKLKDIQAYIHHGIINGSLRIEIPEQKKIEVRFESSLKWTPEEFMDIAGMTRSGSVLMAIEKEYFYLPYHIKDRDGDTWKIHYGDFIRADHPGSHSYSVVTGSFINFKEELRNIIRYSWKPEKSDYQDYLGRAYRYNRVLLENGFEPEEFNDYMRREDKVELMFLESLTRKEIEANYPGKVFVRGNRSYKVYNGRLKDISSRKLAKEELGYYENK